jgi:threonine dehydratase
MEHEGSPLTPTIAQIEAALAALQPYLVETPAHAWEGAELSDLMGCDTRVMVKLELLQRTGSFKPRGALTTMLRLTEEQLRRGVTAVSSGNHAIATAFAARKLGTSAKVVMLRSANPARVNLCRSFGAEIVIAPSGTEGFALAEQLAVREGRSLIHPYEGASVTLGTATLGLEFSPQAGELDAIIIPIGGGGLCAGVAAAMKQLQPNCRVYGVEPRGADVMHRSLAAGKPMPSPPIATIADSLGAPFTCPHTFELCRRYVDSMVLVDDDEIRFAMTLIFRELKFAVEPSAAAATAALIGPLRNLLRGKKVGVILCGANIDFQTYASHFAAAPREPSVRPWSDQSSSSTTSSLEIGR